MLPPRILIVDDDPIVCETLALGIDDEFEVELASSGEEALACIERSRPELVLLDIEMDGMDGFETCRRIRERHTIPVIFVSSHDTLEMRVQAFDCGGDDFVVKPCPSDLLLRKALRMTEMHADRERLAAEKASAQQLAMGFLEEVGKTGLLLNFMRGSLHCTDGLELATRLIEVTGEHGLHCHVQVRQEDEVITLTPRGPASPLESSVIERSVSMGRIFQFSSRLIINFDQVSLLALDLPGDEARAGRLRDSLSILAESAQAIAETIGERKRSAQRAEALQAASFGTYDAVENLRELYREQRSDTRLCMEDLIDRVERSYVHLGLSPDQEDSLSATLREGAERVLQLFARSERFDEQFALILASLRPAGGSAIDNEVWL